MMTIIAPTDFSAASTASVNYAAELAVQHKAKLLLVHSYYAPAVPVEAAIPLPLDQMEQDTQAALHKVERRIRNAHPKLTIQIEAIFGAPETTIVEIAEREGADLIVAGASRTGFVSERLFGSTCTALLNKSPIPVLIIRKGMKYARPRQVGLAIDADYRHDPAMITFLDLFMPGQTNLHVLHICKSAHLLDFKGHEVREQLSRLLPGRRISFHHVVNDDVGAGLSGFIKEQSLDLLIMLPKHHTVLGRLLKGPRTSHMALHGKVPLLALPVLT